MRLDVWLSNFVEGMSRRTAGKWIAAGHVTVNGRPVDKAQLVTDGCKVEIWRPPVLNGWLPKADKGASLEVHYVDETLAVVEKPSGVASVPHSPEESGTLANLAAGRFPQCACVGRRSGDAGLLQRLDLETSGLVMVALSPEAHEALSRAQQSGAVKKTYLALVHGNPPLQCRADTPLRRSGPKGARLRPSPDGATALTEIGRLETVGEWSLVEARILHGVRHQIRAHLSSLGYPIACDPLYGDGVGPAGLARLFLHAHRIVFDHPVTGQTMTVTSPLPSDLRATLDSLRIGVGC